MDVPLLVKITRDLFVLYSWRFLKNYIFKLNIMELCNAEDQLMNGENRPLVTDEPDEFGK